MQTHAAVVVWLALALALACRPSGPTATIATKNGRVGITLEVVADDPSRARGLMYREQLPDGHGMLFVFDEEVEHSFWMKNTLIPLDMIFIDSNRRIVGIIQNATPLSTKSVTVGKPSKWVLEVAGGYSQRAGIATGDHIDLNLSP